MERPPGRTDPGQYSIELEDQRVPAGSPTTITERVRVALEQGRGRDEVVGDLVSSGLSRATAQRYVDRAVAAPPPAVANPTTGPRASQVDSTGRGALISGAFWLSFGCTATGVTYAMAAPGGTFVVTYGAIVAGIAALARGLKRWQTGSALFPFLAVSVAAALPPLGVVALLGVARGREYLGRSARHATEEQRLARARAAQEDLAAAAERAAADEARAQRHAERVARARRLLQTSSNPSLLCDAALDLGMAGSRDAVPDLLEVLGRSRELSTVRNCAASSLVTLGEVDPALSFYVSCAQADTGELRNIAIAGFGKIGARAAPVALPYLTETLRSRDAADRFVTVDALAHLGPAAEALLQAAAADPDAAVRDRATRALAALRH